MCNLIGRDEYKIVRIVRSASICHSLIKKSTTFEFHGRKNKNLLIQNKLMIMIDY